MFGSSTLITLYILQLYIDCEWKQLVELDTKDDLISLTLPLKSPSDVKILVPRCEGQAATAASVTTASLLLPG